ncbi:MAG: sigma-70 family RNA polymerase sigma factor [Phycisphaera sp.]|nr:sigma-70 family RNA polymerase sigma factor [Phycisphaera sp.]
MTESSQNMSQHEHTVPTPVPAPDRFVRLFMATERRLMAFTLSLVPDLAAAEDVLAEATSVMWQKFGEFNADDPNANFPAWAFKIVRFKVMEYRRTQRRDRHLFNDELLDGLAADAEAMTDHVEARSRALADCVNKLPADDRDLVMHRYRPGATLNDTAASVERSTVTVRKWLRRIHDALERCVDQSLSMEGLS